MSWSGERSQGSKTSSQMNELDTTGPMYPPVGTESKASAEAPVSREKMTSRQLADLAFQELIELNAAKRSEPVTRSDRPNIQI